MRRLYDIANVLTTLGLIKKKTFLAPNHRKMPGYAWSGPSMEEIQAIRKSISPFLSPLSLHTKYAVCVCVCVCVCVNPNFFFPPSIYMYM